MHNSIRMGDDRRRTGVLHATVRQILAAALLGPLVLPAARAGNDSQPATGQVAAAAISNEQGTGEVGLQEVVVTAQRRKEDVQKAAIAIDAVSASSLTDAGVADAADLSRLVPAAQFAHAGGPITLYFIRGVGSEASNSLTDPAIAVAYDGVFLARPYIGGQYYDLARVEVLKGPQGTLYGRNATGGAVNIIPQHPLYEFGGDASLEYGNYGQIRVNGDINLPLADQTAVRASFQTIHHSGYLSDHSDDESSQAGRLQFRTEIVPDLSVLIGTDYYHQGGLGVGAAVVSQFSPDERVGVVDPRAAPFYAANGQFYDPNKRRQNNAFWGVHASIDWTTELGTLTVLPAYRHSHEDFYSMQPGFGFGVQETDQQSSLEMRFASNDRQRFKWIVGGYYLNDEPRPTQLIDSGIVPVAGLTQVQTSSLSTKAWAPFADGTFAVSDTVSLLAGVRYTHEEKNADGTLVPSNGVGIVNLNDSRTWTATTWRAGVQWDIAPTSMAYVTVATGFHSGGFFFTADDPTYQPEHIRAYTVGSKNRFLDGRLQANLEAFYWDYRDEQFSHLSLDSHFDIVFKTENIGHVPIKGAELQTQYLLTDNTLVGAQAQYLDAYYRQFTYSQPLIPPMTGCPVTSAFGPAGPLYTVSCQGQQPPHSPRWTLNLALQQTLPLGQGHELVAAINSHFQTQSQTGLDNLPPELQRSYWSTDALLTYRRQGGHWSASAYVNNIGNTAVKSATFFEPFGGIAPGSPPIATASLRPPRLYGLRVMAHF